MFRTVILSVMLLLNNIKQNAYRFYQRWNVSNNENTKK